MAKRTPTSGAPGNRPGFPSHRFTQPFFRRYWNLQGVDEKTSGELDRIGRIIAQKCIQTMRNGGLRQYHMRKWLGQLMAWMEVSVYDNGLGAPLVTVEVRSQPTSRGAPVYVPGLFLVQGGFLLEPNPSLAIDGTYLRNMGVWRLFTTPTYIEKGFYFNGYAATTTGNEAETRTVTQLHVDESGKHWVCGYGAQKLFSTDSYVNKFDSDTYYPITRWCYSNGELIGLKTTSLGSQFVVSHIIVNGDEVANPNTEVLTLPTTVSSEYDKYCLDFWCYGSNVKYVHTLLPEWSVKTLAMNTLNPEASGFTVLADAGGVTSTIQTGGGSYSDTNPACDPPEQTVYWSTFDEEITASQYKVQYVYTLDSDIVREPLFLYREEESEFRWVESLQTVNVENTTRPAISTTTTSPGYSNPAWLLCALQVDISYASSWTEAWVSLDITNSTAQLVSYHYGTVEVKRADANLTGHTAFYDEIAQGSGSGVETWQSTQGVLALVKPAVIAFPGTNIIFTDGGESSASIYSYAIYHAGVELVGRYTDSTIYKRANVIDNVAEMELKFYYTSLNLLASSSIKQDGELGYELIAKGQVVPVVWKDKFNTWLNNQTGVKLKPFAAIVSNLTADASFLFSTFLVRETVPYTLEPDTIELWGYSPLDDRITNLTETFAEVAGFSDAIFAAFMGDETPKYGSDEKLIAPAIRGLARVAVPLGVYS